MARPRFAVSDEHRRFVKSMVAMGTQHEQIAQVIGCRSPKTLRKYFREEIDRGSIEANYQVATALHKKAREGNVTAQIFWLKTRAGWRDRPAFEPASIPPPPFVVALEKGVQQP